MPEVFAVMQADYTAYAKADGVLPMPEGYEPHKQVIINALVNVYVPRLKRAVVALLAGLAVLTVAIVYIRRRRRNA